MSAQGGLNITGQVCATCRARIPSMQRMCTGCGGVDLVPIASQRGMSIIREGHAPPASETAMGTGLFLCRRCFISSTPAKKSRSWVWVGFFACAVLGLFAAYFWLGCIAFAIVDYSMSKAGGRICRHCGADDLVPHGSPAAQMLLRQVQASRQPPLQ